MYIISYRIFRVIIIHTQDRREFLHAIAPEILDSKLPDLSESYFQFESEIIVASPAGCSASGWDPLKTLIFPPTRLQKHHFRNGHCKRRFSYFIGSTKGLEAKR
jgi:hypothetical protein